MAYIDDSLLKRRHVKDALMELLETRDVHRLNRQDFAVLSDAICTTPYFHPDILLDLYLEAEEPIEQTALFLLESLGDAHLLKRMNYFLKNPRMPKEQQEKLLLLKALLQQKIDGVDEIRRKGSLEDFLDVSARLWECLEPEELGMIWLQDYFHLPVEEKLPVLQSFCRSGKACYLGLLSLEARRGAPEIVRMIAGAITEWKSLDALPLLERMCLSSDQAVAAAARRGHTALTSGDSRPVEQSRLYAHHHHFRCYEGRAIDDSSDANMMRYVLYSTINDKGLIKVMVAAINNMGAIQGCLTDVRPNKKSFEALVSNLESTYPGMFFEEVRPESALRQIFKAEQASMKSEEIVPPEYWVWSVIIPPRAILADGMP
jgi:hypothetical protein